MKKFIDYVEEARALGIQIEVLNKATIFRFVGQEIVAVMYAESPNKYSATIEGGQRLHPVTNIPVHIRHVSKAKAANWCLDIAANGI